MSIKALVAGDIHIGRHSSAIPSDVREASTKFTWQRLVDYAISAEADVLLLTGDIIDRDNKYYEAMGPLQAGLEKLSKSEICVYMVAGNHDYDVLPQVMSAGNYEHVHLLGLNGKWEEVVYQKRSTGEAMRLLGWSFPGQYVIDSQLSNLVKPVSATDMPTIALVHGDLYEKNSRYNPLNQNILKSISFIDAWLLGHIHRPDILNEQSPLILYPGSPHALSSKEQGEHGIYSIMIDGHTIGYQAIPYSPVQYQTIQINVSSAFDEETFRSTVVAELRSNTMAINAYTDLAYLVVDIQFVGESNSLRQLELWADKLKEYELDDPYHVSVRSVEFLVKPKLDFVHLASDTSYIGVLAAAILKLEAGESNPFTDNLLSDWKAKFRAVMAASVYAPLAIQEDNIDEMAREYVLAECRKLIAELNNQRNL